MTTHQHPSGRHDHDADAHRDGAATYDPKRTSISELRDWVRECGFHCAPILRPTRIR